MSDYTLYNYLRELGPNEFGLRVDDLLKRPEPVHGNIPLPTVRDIDEAEVLCREFGAVLTAGPEAREVAWGHPNHRVWTFDDTTNLLLGPGLRQVAEMVEWGAQQEDLLVHCHAGISRSTATAWGVAIARGADPLDSFIALRNAHPYEQGGVFKRTFCPNRLIVAHLEIILKDGNLLRIREEMLSDDPYTRNWV